MKTLWKVLRRAAEWLLLILVTIVLVRAFQARKPPYLKPWHRFAPPSEMRAAELTESFTFEEYQRREEKVFGEVKESIEDRLPSEERTSGNRYFAEGASSPRRFPRDWNRTFELEPAELRGGALLIHGLTDGPYSMRAVAELLRDRGYYCLALRMPGHGTVPGGLVRAQWEDWIGAVQVGARHVSRRIGPGKPFVIVGYSNGGALAVKYSLDVLDGASLPKADRLVLLSPMIGVSAAAGLAQFVGLLAVIPYFEKTRWLDVVPEYNPFKYNSFPANAGEQSARLTGAIQGQIERAAGAGRLGALPPMLTFQSAEDATVEAGAIVQKLYDPGQAKGSELVLFDLNQRTDARPFLNAGEENVLARLAPPRRRPYTLTVVTNAAPDTNEAVERRVLAGTDAPQERPLGLSWPPQVFSLSHVAVPFPAGDPLYGGQPDPRLGGGIHLGIAAPRGERGVLGVAQDAFLRMSWNPFFPYVQGRISEWLTPAR
jgi:alpha-beta hydrolase superfamily lysophospholipase